MCNFRWSDIEFIGKYFDDDEIYLIGKCNDSDDEDYDVQSTNMMQVDACHFIKQSQPNRACKSRSKKQSVNVGANLMKKCVWCDDTTCRYVMHNFAKLRRGNAVHEPVPRGPTFDEEYRIGILNEENELNPSVSSKHCRDPQTHAEEHVADFDDANATIITQTYEDISREEDALIDRFNPHCDSNHTNHQMKSYQQHYQEPSIDFNKNNSYQTNNSRIPVQQQSLLSPVLASGDKQLFCAANSYSERSSKNIHRLFTETHHKHHPVVCTHSDVPSEMALSQPNSGLMARNCPNLFTHQRQWNTMPIASNMHNLESMQPAHDVHQRHFPYTANHSLTPVPDIVLSASTQKNIQRQHQRQTADRDAQKIKRPLNSFMIFMREKRDELSKGYRVKESALVNQIVAKEWRSLSDKDKNKYRQIAFEEKQEHAKKYPMYNLSQKSLSNGDSFNKTLQKRKPRCNKKCSTTKGSNNIDEWCDICKSKRRVIQFARIIDEKKRSNVNFANDTMSNATNFTSISLNEKTDNNMEQDPEG